MVGAQVSHKDDHKNHGHNNDGHACSLSAKYSAQCFEHTDPHNFFSHQPHEAGAPVAPVCEVSKVRCCEVRQLFIKPFSDSLADLVFQCSCA